MRAGIIVDARPYTFIATSAPEPVVDFETKRVKVVDGQPVFQISLLVMSEGADGEVIKVKISNEPKVTAGMFVTVSGLVARQYTVTDRQTGALRAGMSYRADAIVGAPAPVLPASTSTKAG
ncbi:hypothetical protein [Frankia sp. Cj5]|uniref:hypothetical protein n=1 Tax=Frankia sp. Cj5 TaxID=2880978 RepID=UPI001EF469B5|nr:hypothetical protein [Frankia sp. Cj5]